MSEKWKIPSYDGSPEMLQAYREEVLQYMMAVEVHKRYLVGPRLVQELTGVARTLVRTKTLKDPQWLSHARGAYELLRFLEDELERPSLLDANKHVTAFFYNMERKKGESMTAWVARHSEKLWEASRAIQRVQREHEKQGKSVPAPRSSQWGSAWESQSQRSQHSHPFGEDGRLAEDDDEEGGGPDHQNQYWTWGQRSWDWSQSGDQWSWKSPEYDPPHEWEFDERPFIPEFLAGFLLLHRSGLEPAEKSNILTAIKGEFTTQAVAKALREQWSDVDLTKHDKHRMGSALVALEGDIGEDEAYHLDYTQEEIAMLGEEEQEAFWTYDQEAEHALEAIRQHKATLKEARWKQRQVKLGRSFFPPKPFQKSSATTRDGKKSVLCFKCGEPHFQRDCPLKNKEAQVTHEEEAEIAFTVTPDQTTQEESAQFGNTQEGNFNLGAYGILDSGATASWGSVDAMEAWREANLAESGKGKMVVDPSRCPTFKFGNGQKKVCLSTVQVGIDVGDKKGNFEVHVHDSPGQPILVSRRALKSLGAIVDFKNNQIVYTNVDPHTVVPLKEANNGHLLMPLVGNLLEGGTKRATPIFHLAE